MGADIHITIERKWKGQWVGVASDRGIPLETYASDTWDYRAPAIGDRDYAFFARLAGVRGDGPRPNGLPPDMSQYAEMRADADIGDMHSAGHLPLHDFAMRWCAGDPDFMAQLTAERLEGKDGLLRKLYSKASVGAFEAYCESVEDYRVVFWFDN